MSFGADEAAALLARHKVARIALRTLGEFLHVQEASAAESAILCGVRDRLTKHLEPIDARMDTSEAVLRVLLDQRRRTGSPVWTMKGFAARGWYPPDRPRDVGDLDLLVPDIDSAWRLVEPLLADRGYTFPAGELPWFKGDLGTGALYGQVRVVTPRRDSLSVDVHAGPYSVRHCARMPLAALSSPDAAGPDPDAFPPVDPTDNLCCVLGNAAGDCFVDAKTINDIWLALTMNVDVDRLHRILDEADLLPFFLSCLDRVEELCLVDSRRARALSSWRPPGEREEPAPLDGPRATHRLRVTVEHARRVAARMPGADHEFVARIGQSAERAYSADLPLRLVEPDEGEDVSRLPELVNWTCVRMVPPALLGPLVGGNGRMATGPVPRRQLSAELSVLSTRNGDLLAVGGGVFVPTVGFGVPRALAAEAVGRERVADDSDG